MKYAGLNTTISNTSLFSSFSDLLMARGLFPSVLIEKTAKNAPEADESMRQPGFKAAAPARAPFVQRVRNVIAYLFTNLDVLGQRQTDQLIRQQYNSADAESRISEAEQLELLEARKRCEEKERTERFKYNGL